MTPTKTEAAVVRDGSSDERRGFLALDGLRGVAAIAIVLRHSMADSAIWLPRSYLSVDLFFALSGFVLFHVYVPRFNAGLRPGIFLVQRLIRLYPLYILGTLACVALALAEALIGNGAHPPIDRMIASAALNIAFLPVPPGLGLYGGSAFPFNFPSWSLFWELAVNIVFAGAVLWLTPQRLIWLVAFGAVLLIGSGLYFGDLDTGSTHTTFFGGGGRVVYSFFVGGIVHKIWHSGRIAWRISFPTASVLLLLSFIPQLAGEAGMFYDLVIALIGYPLLLLLTANAVVSPRVGRICHVLGVSSYAMYVIHAAIIALARIVYPHVMHTSFEMASPPLGLMVCVSAFCVALVLDRYYDRPIRSWLSKRLSRSTSRQQP